MAGVVSSPLRFGSASLSVRLPSNSGRPCSLRSRRLPPRLTRIYALTSNDIKVGTTLEMNGSPWKVLEFLHVKPGKGAAFVRTKLKNVINGNVLEKTLRAGSTITEAYLSKETKQFTYKDGSLFVFMDMNSFEEHRLTEEDIGDRVQWLKEGMDCTLLFWNEKVIDFEVPSTVKLVVTDVPIANERVQGGSKPATLETGAIVNVPLHLDIGQEIVVDTRTGQYAGKA